MKLIKLLLLLISADWNANQHSLNFQVHSTIIISINSIITEYRQWGDL